MITLNKKDKIYTQMVEGIGGKEEPLCQAWRERHKVSFMA